ncbi:MAG: sugar ABC transporter permease [Comamonadaceae bacterium]|nr:MAG: sugar ABC transporter permease [Comamonadaceae bacterium]
MKSSSTDIPRKDRWTDRWVHELSGYKFLMIWLTGFFLFTFGPTIASLYLSFTEYDLARPPVWVGLENYARILTEDSKFRDALHVTFVYVVLSVPLKLVAALAVAMILNKGLSGLSIYRAIFYLPSLLGGSVAISILWRQFFSTDGLATYLMRLMGYEGPGWITTPDHALDTLIILSIWQFGSPMIIFLAGLRQIPRDMYEAASIDGAGPVRQFFKITLPLLTPVIFFNAVMQTIEAFKAFTPAFIISGGTGEPVNSTLFYTLYLYQEAFAYLRMGNASALAWILIVIIASFTAIAFLTSKLWVHYDE